MFIHETSLKQVRSHKYLGTHMDNKLREEIHVDTICSRMQQRLYFLCRLRLFGVEQKIMFLFYRAVTESICYGITVWFGNLAIQVKSLHEDCIDCMPGKYSSEDHWEKIIFVP